MIFAHDAQLIAEAAPTALQAGVGTLYIVAIVVPILVLVCSIIGLVIMARRQPPVVEEMYRTFITKSEHAETVSRIDHSVEVAFSEINAIRGQLTKAYGDFERALGRVEGALESIAKHNRGPHHH